MIKVVVGGLLAIPIAYLLVLWAFTQDPLNVGPTLGKVVPFMVPAELREDNSESEAEAEQADDESNSEKDVDESDELAVPSLDPNRVLDPDLIN